MKFLHAIFKFIRNSKILRSPLLAANRTLFSLLECGPLVLRRAAYDAMTVPYLVTGSHESFVVATADKVIGRELFLHGEFDFSKLKIALAIIEREGLLQPRHLIDVGANIGTITIPAIVRGLMETATAIEPHPINIRLLNANIALNDVGDKVRVVNQAVGAESAKTLFLHESATNGGNHSIALSGIPVRSSRLDDIEQPRGDALLWMDIEGYEGHALQGAACLLKSGMPVVCEFNPDFLERSGGKELFFQALAAFRIFDLKQGVGAKEINLNVLSECYPAGSDFTDILAIPMSAKMSI